jgi:hypothetical protein
VATPKDQFKNYNATAIYLYKNAAHEELHTQEASTYTFMTVIADLELDTFSVQGKSYFSRTTLQALD